MASPASADGAFFHRVRICGYVLGTPAFASRFLFETTPEDLPGLWSPEVFESAS